VQFEGRRIGPVQGHEPVFGPRHQAGNEGGVACKPDAFPAFNEMLLGILLVTGAIVIFATNYEKVREINLFGFVLLVQSVPFLAAAALAAFEHTRFNSFTFWSGLEARLRSRGAAIQLGTPPELVRAELPVVEAAMPAEERIEVPTPVAAAPIAAQQMLVQ
jgi:hypothetical protein